MVGSRSAKEDRRSALRNSLIVWTASQVEVLAPDASSLRAAREIAEARKWTGLGQSAQALWGLCQGSGKSPYQAQVDLSEPAFRCSCPSRKFPCKHGLALMLLWVQQPEALTQGEPPGWVGEWLAGRVQRAARPKVEKAPDPEAQARRANQRQARVEEGVAFLRTWLRDLMRAGLSALPGLPDSHWQLAAARLVDSQASGLARMVGRIPSILAGPDWQPRLLTHLGRLHLLLEGFTRLEELGPGHQAEIRTRMGWSQNQEELLKREGVTDRWWVLGQRIFEDDTVSTLRTWLWAEHLGQPALLLDFAAGNRPLPRTLSVGNVVEGELVFFEGASPSRALAKNTRLATAGRRPAGHPALDSFLHSYAETLAVNPWLEECPALLDQVMPGSSTEELVDSQGQAIPLHPGFSNFWRLAAKSGGYPVTVFGEWNGHHLRPLSVDGEDLNG